MPDDQSRHRKGVALVVAAAVAWSTAPFFTRLLPLDSWTILFWRGIFAGAFVLAVLTITQGSAGLRSLIRMGRNGWLVATLLAIGMTTFIPALQLTSVANVAVINAAGPFLAAALAWVWLREAASPRTLLACLVALCGVAVIFGKPGGDASLKGIALACVMALAIAAMTVIVRRHRDTPIVAAAALSNFLGSLVGWLAAPNVYAVSGADVLALAVFGIFQVGLGLTLFMLGSRLLPSGQAALIATLETPLMPFWVWLAFQEIPSTRALIGGALVLGAVFLDILGNLRSAQAKLGSSRQ